MTAADRNPQPEVASSDSEKIDRIAAYVDDQRRSEDSWIAQWGKFSAYLAVAAFLFGVGTFSDIRNLLPSADPLPTSEERYAQQVSASCLSVINANPIREKVIIDLSKAAAYDQNVLKFREKMSRAFSISVPDDMSQKNRAALSSAFLFYRSADSFLRAAVESAKAGDAHAYTVEIAHYKQSSAAFAKAAADGNISSCRYYWGTAVTNWY
ncbi:hypothetical protein [Streptomyces clavifer]|uniref:hypothetical protein n=1 Tax=Streptomyces clavifer TaxID=68188 RepID=UPI00381B07D7